MTRTIVFCAALALLATPAVAEDFKLQPKPSAVARSAAQRTAIQPVNRATMSPAQRTVAVRQLTGLSKSDASGASVRYGLPSSVPAGGGVGFGNAYGFNIGSSLAFLNDGGIASITVAGKPQGIVLFECVVSGGPALAWSGSAAKPASGLIGAPILVSASGNTVFAIDMSLLSNPTVSIEGKNGIWGFQYCDVTQVTH